MTRRRAIGWALNEDLVKAGGVYGSMVNKYGRESAEAAAAQTEVRAVRARLAVEELLNSDPEPTAEQLNTLRALLGSASR